MAVWPPFCRHLILLEESFRIFNQVSMKFVTICRIVNKTWFTGDPLHSRALAHSRAPLFTQPCSHCSHSRAPGEQWARLCVFTLHGCVQLLGCLEGHPWWLFQMMAWCLIGGKPSSEPTEDTCILRQIESQDHSGLISHHLLVEKIWQLSV